MKTAIVTGASSGIGKEIVKSLLEKGYFVYGLARDFSKCEVESENFLKRECNLTNRKEITLFWEQMKKKQVDILVNCAGVGYFGNFDSMGLDEIEEMVDLNLKAPLFLSRLFYQHLKNTQGFIININSISATKPAIFGAVYGATKAGLRHFGTSLFAESRKAGVKVVNIQPDLTKTPWFDDKNFGYFDDKEFVLEPSEIAKLISYVLEMDGVVTEVNVEPRKFRVIKRS